MGFLDSIRTAMGFDNEPDDADYGGDYDYEQKPEPVQPQQYRNQYGQNNMPAGDDRSRLNISVTAQLQVILVKPEKFADTKEIANHLNNKKTVVLNLEATTPDVTRRIIDFLGGVAYANGGSIKPVANNTFIITPYNVGFQGDELSAELESNGVLL